jgi:hypothetical protein
VSNKVSYEYNRTRVLKCRYGITLDDYANMLESQGGGCAICGAEPGKGRVLDVDHCHDEGHVRGLLCRSCNLCLGRMKDDPSMLRKAADYLENS